MTKKKKDLLKANAAELTRFDKNANSPHHFDKAATKPIAEIKRETALKALAPKN